MSDKLQFVVELANAPLWVSRETYDKLKSLSDNGSVGDEGSMSNLDYKQFAERHRPHIHPPGGILFVTYRLTGSIPKATVRDYKAKKDWFANELKRARNIVQRTETPELKEWLERIEKFDREWFMVAVPENAT